jgi:glucose/arabinose dehydrogenase
VFRAGAVGLLSLAFAATLCAQPVANHVTLVPTIPSGLTQPIGIVNAGDGSNRLFIVEQPGKIRVWKNGVLLGTPFLDLSGSIQDCATTCSGERGLLGLAFHPDYESNGFFYVFYTRKNDAATPAIDETGDLLIARYHVSANPDVADSASALRLLTIDHSAQGNHNGGNLMFKPGSPDAFLYIGTGDGGGGGDPFENGQNISTALLGKLLRIDVGAAGTADAFPADAERNYAIPAANPFVGVAGLDEIWDYGLRNPWRWSFDRVVGDLYIGDVGQGPTNPHEEIDFEPSDDPGGVNYGWDCREGAHDYNDTNGDLNVNCGSVVSQDPILEYDHSGGRCSVTGGYVYRGDTSPGGASAFISGHYIFGDFCSGDIWHAFKTPPSTWTSATLFDTSFNISTFGEDQAGKLYVADRTGGAVYRIAPYSFTDVLPDSNSWTAIESVYRAGVSQGCAADRFCGDGPVQRQQLAALLLRAQDPGANPPSCSSQPFDDVMVGTGYCRWIRDAQTIIGACDGGTHFCPTQPVTHGALAGALFKAVHPAAPDPPPCGPGDLYSDVAAGDPLCRWIQAAVQEGLVSACDEGNDTFCRNAPVRRDHLAAILVNAFSGTIPESTP